MIGLDLELPLGARSLRVDTELPDGVTVLMGPSGAGKTSLLEAIAGLRPRASGRVVVGEHVLLDTAAGVRLAPERRRVGYVPQDAGLFPHLDVARNVAFGARDAASVGSAVRALEIEPLLGRAPATLSGGEKQRVALARALASAPRLLLLDEPLAALDRALRERIIPYLLRIRAEWGVPALYVTHNVGEAVVLGGHLVILEDGRITGQGAPLEMLGTPAVRREAAQGIENLLSGRVVAHDEAGGVTRVRLDAGPPVTLTLAAALSVGAPILLAIRAEDVLVASKPVAHLSARNVYEALLTSVEETGHDVTLRCRLLAGGDPWLVRLTRAAVRELSLAEGARVWLAVKSHSVRLV